MQEDRAHRQARGREAAQAPVGRRRPMPGRRRPSGDSLAFDALLAEVRACRLCTEHPLTRPLPHQPRPVLRAAPSARVLVAGQAPGVRVHASGLPFDDRSGERLRAWMGIGRETFYDAPRSAVGPIGFCFPGLDEHGGDLPPRRECAPRWRAEVLRHLDRVELVLAVGRHAQAWHLGAACPGSLTDTVRAWRACLAAGMPRVLPLPHPSWRNNAWLQRNPWFGAEVVPWLQREVERLLR
jgi:uracil-DNA glycosylase